MDMARGTEMITTGAPTTENQTGLPVPGNSPALASYPTAIGEHHTLSLRWWVGCACTTPEELRSVQGIVIYNKTECLFFAEDEARKVSRMTSVLLAQLAGERKGS